MPKPTVFKANSVVYFQGDTDDRIYILKSGRIVLRSRDIETGEDLNDLIQTGEFFGVKSALGRYPREEDAVVLAEAQVIQFSVPEFEQLAASNTRIIIKMLKVFSNQLRRIHSKVSSMLNQEDQVDPAEGLHHSAAFYYKNRQYAHARYIWGRYLELYPDGPHADEAREAMQRADQSAQAQSTRTAAKDVAQRKPGSDLPPIAQLFFEAESSLANEKFDDAVRIFQEVIDADEAGEYRGKAEMGLGRAYFAKGDHAATIRQFSTMIKEAPRHPEMADMLYHVGASYAETGNTDKAKAFLGKAKSHAEDEPALKRKIARTLEKIG